MSDNRAAKTNARWHPWRMAELGRPASFAEPDPGPSREEAQQQALREKAHQEAYREGHAEGLVQGHAEGYRQGLAQALEEGRKQAEDERQQTARDAARLLENLDQALERIDTDISRTLIDVALAAARHLAHEALDEQPERVCALIQNLLQSEPFLGGQTFLWLHPDDVALVTEQMGDQLKLGGWNIRKDPSLQRGGCRVSGPDGELDATREARWQTLLDRHRPASTLQVENASKPNIKETSS